MSHEDLLHRAYQAFRDPPASHWSMDSLPDIRSRVDATFIRAEDARCEQRWLLLGSGQRLRLCLYWPTHQGAASTAPATPALLYLHGGGFVLGRPEMADAYLAELAAELGALIVAVDYRLAPEYPFPVPLEDCYAALGWVFDHACTLNVDRQRVILHGHSAGGGLAAALALLVRERARFRVTGLVMVYPMLDHRSGSSTCAEPNPSTGDVGWSRSANQFCWSCLQGAYAVDDDRRMLFSPALADDLSGLPPSFIAVGALDLFVDENLAFALALSRAGVPIEFHLYPGVPHMFDQLPGPQTDQCLRDARHALKVLCSAGKSQ